MNNPDPIILDRIQLETGSTEPLYAQVARFLEGLISTGFEDGDVFFTDKVLVTHLPVSEVTIRQAMRILVDKGLVARTRGRGTVVHLASAVAVAQTQPVAPNVAGHSTPRRKLRTVGIFRPTHMVAQSEHGSALMDEFHAQCDSRGLECRFYDATSAESVMKSFAEITSDPDEEAFVLHTTLEATSMLYHSLTHRGYRSVAMEGASAIYPGWMVETDAAEAARIGVRHLVELGHRQIVLLVNEPSVEPTVIEKIDAFKETTASFGLDETCRVVLCQSGYGDSYEGAYNHMVEAMGDDLDACPTAIMTVSDPGAWAVLKWCSQNGLRVPKDISVLGFEDARSSKYMIPSLSSIAHPRQKLVNTMLDVLSGEMSGPSKRILVPPTLMLRESTGTSAANVPKGQRNVAGPRHPKTTARKPVLVS